MGDLLGFGESMRHGDHRFRMAVDAFTNGSGVRVAPYSRARRNALVSLSFVTGMNSHIGSDQRARL